MNRNILGGVILTLLVIFGLYLLRQNNKSSAPTVIIQTPTTSPTSQATTPSPTLTPILSPSPTISLTTARQVNINNFSFDPAITSVPKGTTVIWTNNDNVPHTVTNDNNIFASSTLQPGQTFSYTFNDPGSFPYHCVIHPNMRATVTVTQ